MEDICLVFNNFVIFVVHLICLHWSGFLSSLSDQYKNIYLNSKEIMEQAFSCDKELLGDPISHMFLCTYLKLFNLSTFKKGLNVTIFPLNSLRLLCQKNKKQYSFLVFIFIFIILKMIIALCL